MREKPIATIVQKSSRMCCLAALLLAALLLPVVADAEDEAPSRRYVILGVSLGGGPAQYGDIEDAYAYRGDLPSFETRGGGQFVVGGGWKDWELTMEFGGDYSDAVVFGNRSEVEAMTNGLTFWLARQIPVLRGRRWLRFVPRVGLGGAQLVVEMNAGNPDRSLEILRSGPSPRLAVSLGLESRWRFVGFTFEWRYDWQRFSGFTTGNGGDAFFDDVDSITASGSAVLLGLRFYIGNAN